MAFSTISTFSSLKFPTAAISINYIYSNVDSSMSIYYPFNFSSGSNIPNYKSGTIVYDSTIVGGGSINNTLPNYIIGNGALQLIITVYLFPYGLIHLVYLQIIYILYLILLVILGLMVFKWI